MDRRNGGDPLAPPRPPKLLPRVHRPRAPEPTTIMGETSATVTPTVTKSTATTTTSAAAAAAVAAARATQCTNNSSSSNNNNNHSDHLSQQNQQQQFYSITTTAPTISNNNNNNNNINNSIRSGVDHHNSSNINNTSNNNGNVASLGVPPSVEFDDYQIHHLTYLPQLPSSLSRNSSHVSSASSSSSITAANSFTRRRQPPPTPGSAVPLLALASGSVSSTNSSSNFLSHFQTAAAVAAATDATSASPVTLAQPRPESERLTNEYVDTPLRTAAAAATATVQQLQLQHASRSQHPAGQHDNGQTTTHHLLQLPQRRLQQQQQQQLQQQHSSRLVATTATGHGSGIGIGIGIDGTDGFLHSHHQHQQQQHQQQHHKVTSTQTSSHAPGKGTPPPPPRGLGLGLGFGNAQPITQPITKQPASSFSKEELFDLHSLAGGTGTLHGSASDVNGLNGSTSTIANTMGPVLAAGVNSTMDMKSIMCPLCGKCRCDQCLSPRSLPQTWVCNKTCLCSAESVIDYASCLCCAKALFYHCARDNDMDCDDGSGTPCVDNPCSCGPYKRTQRWSWLGALSLVLPCLWFYWPMRGCVSLCEKCYARYAGRGCRCQPIGSMSSMSPIMQLSINGSSGGGMLGNGSAGTTNGSGILNGQSMAKSVDGQHHRIRHTECSAASRKLRKGDLTPEKCLLDSSPEY